MPAKPLFILLADDDQEDLELFREIILSVVPATRVDEVKNGNDLVKFLVSCEDDELPNMIILDYNMPLMKGGALLSELNGNRYKHISKFVLSTSDADLHIKECLDNGAKSYFVKPDNLLGLETVVRKMITLHES